MSTHALNRHTQRRVGVRLGIPAHWAWLARGFVLAFAIPLLFADLLEINRDVFYGLYALLVFGLIGLWARSTGYDLVAAIKRRWLWAVGLGAVFAGVMALMVVRTEDATTRPEGLKLIGAVFWRGVVYGATDGLLLSVFPILVVFAAFAGSRLNQRFSGKLVIGAAAMIASLAMTAVYHAGYSDFRSGKIGCTSLPSCTATTRPPSCRPISDPDTRNEEDHDHDRPEPSRHDRKPLSLPP
jgi:hypothetical protein